MDSAINYAETISFFCVKKARTLSMGMKQRLSIAMALTVLDKTMDDPQYKVVSGDTIHLYSGKNNMEKISRALMQHEIVIKELSVTEQTLEDYFMSITGGASNV